MDWHSAVIGNLSGNFNQCNFAEGKHGRFIPCFIVSKKNIVSRELNIPVAMRTEDFCMKAIPAYFVATAAAYFFTGDSSHAHLLIIDYAKIKSPSVFLETLRSGELVITSLMVVSFVLFFAFWLAARKKAVKK